MVLARHEYNEEVMEANRVKFYERFAKDQPHLTYEPTYKEKAVVEPISLTTCEKYLESERCGRVRISCQACRDRNICLTGNICLTAS